MKVLIKHWRSNGIFIFGFVDDILWGPTLFETQKEFPIWLRKICLKVDLL